MSEFIRFDEERQLFVVSEAGGYSCLGLDVAQHKVDAVAEWCGWHPGSAPRLTPDADGYRAYVLMMETGQRRNERTGQQCPAELTPQLNGLEGRRVEVTDKYGETRRFQVGKSRGWMPCHLEIARRDSMGGPAVMGAPFQSVKVIR